MDNTSLLIRIFATNGTRMIISRMIQIKLKTLTSPSRHKFNWVLKECTSRDWILLVGNTRPEYFLRGFKFSGIEIRGLKFLGENLRSLKSISKCDQFLLNLHFLGTN